MRTIACLFLFLLLPAFAAEHTIAVVGLVHSHVWGHLKEVLPGQPARLVGVAETEPELVAEAQKRGVPANLIFADWKKMIDQQKPEIVWSFVENNRHREIVEYCAPRKIHVLFEKPLASNYKEALAIRDLARKHGIYVMTNYQMAWWPANYTARKLAASGAVGQVWRLHGIVGHGGPGGPTGLNKYFFNWLTDPVKNGGGALVDFGCYNALWSLWYLGRPETVYAQSNQLRPKEFPKVEDNADIILNYKQGVAILDLEVFGLGGGIHVSSDGVTLRKSGQREAHPMPVTALPPEASTPLAAMIHCIESKTEPQGLTSLDMNIQVVEILDAAKESLKTGRAVRLAARK
jgi:predicted dehydrogenase